MIISRTPFRISFFGGGTDYPAWYLKYGGEVLATSINKYCYISCRYLPPFFEHRIRIVYSKIENCKTFADIQHPSVRETVRFLEIHRGLEVHHDGDLPARSGMGSSSAFTVGLLHGLYALKGVMPSKRQLALESIHIEQNMIHETVGSQDQVTAAYGGLNHIIFRPDSSIAIRPVTLSRDRLEELNSHLMLFYTGIKRTASDMAKTYVNDLESKKEHLSTMQEMVGEALDALTSNRCICNFGELLHKSWMLKRGLSPNISNGEVDHLYEFARANGAIGGKITGAGGGGFLLLFVPPSAHKRIREALQDLLCVPFKFDFSGTQIIFYEPSKEDFAALDRERTLNAIRPFRELSLPQIDD
jgi:D-glycero-alpha-D-manno-heptose-7-phosphate kinase